MVPSTDDAAPTAPPPVMMLEQSANITAWGDFFRDMALVERSFLSEAHHVLWLMGFCAVMVLVVAKKFRDAGAKPGKAPADSPLTESGVAGL